jgi:hypothetical protein
MADVRCRICGVLGFKFFGSQRHKGAMIADLGCRICDMWCLDLIIIAHSLAAFLKPFRPLATFPFQGKEELHLFFKSDIRNQPSIFNQKSSIIN